LFSFSELISPLIITFVIDFVVTNNFFDMRCHGFKAVMYYLSGSF